MLAIAPALPARVFRARRTAAYPANPGRLASCRAAMHFAPGGNIRGLEPLAGRPFDVKDYDVPLVLDYPTRPFQSSVVRIVFFEPVIGGPVAFVAGPEFPFHLRASPGNRFADTVQTQAVLAAAPRFPRLPYSGSDLRNVVSRRGHRPWASLAVKFFQSAMKWG